MSVHVQWIGNAFFTIRTGDKLIFTDPWVTNNPGAALTVEEAAGMAPTHVWVSHGHPGHYGRGDSVQIANLSRSTYYSTKEVIRYVQDRDLLHTRYLGFEPGSRLLADGVDVEVFSVAHPPEPPVAPEWRDLPGAPNTISVFQTGGRTLLHVGDTMLDPAYDDIAERYQIDLAMLPLDPRLGEDGFRGPQYLLETAEIRRFLPMHQWGDFGFTEKFLARYPEFRSRTLPVAAEGQTFSL